MPHTPSYLPYYTDFVPQLRLPPAYLQCCSSGGKWYASDSFPQKSPPHCCSSLPVPHSSESHSWFPAHANIISVPDPQWCSFWIPSQGSWRSSVRSADTAPANSITNWRSDALVSDTQVSWKPEFPVPLRHRSVHYNRVLPDDSVPSWFHIFLSIYMVQTRRKIHLLRLHNTEYTHLQSLILLLFSYSFPVYYKRFTTRRSIPDFINCSTCSGIRSNVSSKANSEL